MATQPVTDLKAQRSKIIRNKNEEKTDFNTNSSLLLEYLSANISFSVFDMF